MVGNAKILILVRRKRNVLWACIVYFCAVYGFRGTLIFSPFFHFFFTSIQYSRYSEWNIIILEWHGILNIIKSSGNTDFRNS